MIEIEIEVVSTAFWAAFTYSLEIDGYFVSKYLKRRDDIVVTIEQKP